MATIYLPLSMRKTNLAGHCYSDSKAPRNKPAQPTAQEIGSDQVSLSMPRPPARCHQLKVENQLAKGAALDIPGPEHEENAKDDHREQWSKTKTNRYDPAGIPGGRRL